LPWRAERFTREDWLKEYVQARYGTDDKALQQPSHFLVACIYYCSK
jgi:alpha-N-acetylglucosaminidase